MSGNPSIPAKTLPQGASDAAVMESLAENRYLLDYFSAPGGDKTLAGFSEYCKGVTGADRDPQVQILQDYLERNGAAGSYQILDVTRDAGEGTKLLVRGAQAGGGSAYYVGFQGTQGDEWIDNGEGMVQESTLQQQDAARYFDNAVEKYHIMDQDTVVVTGHSKGGNKAQYVTMASEHADLVDSCVAFDGQGFSPEAVAKWKQYPDLYESRRQKITLVAGENDYVHVLGVRLATDENTYYVAYDPSYAKQEDFGVDGVFASYHYNHFLFQTVWDEEQQRYVFSSQLQRPAVQGELSKLVQDINDYLMSLPPEERLSASVTFMCMLGEGSVDGYTPSLSDVISTLNTLYELLDRKLGALDDVLMAKRMPRVYLTLKTINRLIRRLENLRNQWEAYRVERAQAKAASLAQGDPYIYIDTAAWSRLGSELRTLGGADYGAVRRRLVDLRDQLDDLSRSVANVIRAALRVQESAGQTIAQLNQTITDLMSGDVIGAVANSIETARSALSTARAAFDLVTTVLGEARNFAESIARAICRIVQAIALIGVEDTVRELGGYLADTAQEFQMAESQNIALMRQWGG